MNLILGKAIETSSEEISNVDLSVIIATLQNNSAPKPIIKTARAQPKALQRFANIQQILNPCRDLKHNPDREIETWALGSVFKTVRQWANKCLNNAAIIENYHVGQGMVRNIIKTSNVKQW